MQYREQGDANYGTPQDVEKNDQGQPLLTHVLVNLDDGKTH